MTSHAKRTVWNTRERFLSTDLTAMQALLDAQISDTAVAGSGLGHTLTQTSSGMSGVVDGFAVSADAPGVTSVVRIGKGLAYKVVAPADVSTDSRYQRVEAFADLTVDLQPFRSASPRWVCVGVKPALQTVTTSARDIWDPALGTFSSADVPKVVASLPEVVVTAGVAAGIPVLPDGVADVIPLAYVYLTATPALTITTTDLVLCRPLYGRINAQPAGRSEGGGCGVATFGATTVSLRRAQGQWGSLGHYAVNAAATLNINGGGTWEAGQSYADLTGNLTNKCVSVYACAPPWPTGHDADVLALSREFLDFTGRFAGAPAGLTPGCVLVQTHSGPTTTNHLGSTGDIVLSDTIWGSGGTVTTSHYLGSVSYVHAPVKGLLPQVTDGSDVNFTQVMSVSTTITLASDTANASVENEAYDPTAPGSAGTCYPPNTRLCDVGYYWDVASGAAGIVSLVDDASTVLLPAYQWAVTSSGDQRGRVRLNCVSHAARITVATVVAQDIRFEVHVCGYRDPYLAQR